MTTNRPNQFNSTPRFMRLVLTGVVVALTTLAFTAGGHSSSAGPALQRPTNSVRIGTYDSRAIGLAHGRSRATAEKFGELRVQHKKAADAGNQDEASALEKEAVSRQIRMHLQVFSNAPVDDAFDVIRGELPAIAKRLNVVAIVSSIDYKDSSVETVDVTDELVKLFNPTEETLKIIADCRTKKPLPIEEVAQLPANE